MVNSETTKCLSLSEADFIMFMFWQFHLEILSFPGRSVHAEHTARRRMLCYKISRGANSNNLRRRPIICFFSTCANRKITQLFFCAKMVKTWKRTRIERRWNRWEEQVALFLICSEEIVKGSDSIFFMKNNYAFLQKDFRIFFTDIEIEKKLFILTIYKDKK